MRAIQITEFGGAEVLTPVDLPAPEPAAGQVRIDVRLAGGGYAEQAVAAESLTFPIPDGVEDAQALALVLQGTTAWHILRTSAQLRAGESVVVHAAAGGVGSLALQLARAFGAGRVIASASSEGKRDLARSLGAHAAVDSTASSLQGDLEEANDGRKVDVVLEMAGGAVFDASLAALAPFGRLITYGTASRRPPAPLDAGALMARSRAVVGFWLAHCMTRPKMLRRAMDDLFARVLDGSLRPVLGGGYPLGQAARAHEDLRARRTTGKLVLDARA